MDGSPKEESNKAQEPEQEAVSEENTTDDTATQNEIPDHTGKPFWKVYTPLNIYKEIKGRLEAMTRV